MHPIAPALLGAAAVLALAWVNGANDNLKGMAALVAARQVSSRRARQLATLACALGSVLSLVAATALAGRMRPPGDLQPLLLAWFPACTGLGAFCAIGAATWMGLPTSTTHAVLGALAGVSLTHGGGYERVLATLPALVLPLALVPLAALGAGAVISSLLPRGDGDASPGTRTDPAGGATRPSARRAVLAGTALCIARALNDTPKLAALLGPVPALGSWGPSSAMATALVGLSMGAGGWLHGRGVLRTLAVRLAQPSRATGASTTTVSATMVLGASALGLPVSTTHVTASTAAGAGWAMGGLRTRWAGAVAAAWALTFPVGALTGFLSAQAVLVWAPA